MTSTHCHGDVGFCLRFPSIILCFSVG